MEGSRRKGLSVHLLLLLLISTLPSSSSQANNRKCFVCSSLTSSKCEGALSESDTEFIKECPTSPQPDSTDLFTASGCIVLLVFTLDYVHPSGRYLWRDCLYSMDLNFPLDHVSPNPPWSTSYVEWVQSSWYEGHKSAFVRDFNNRRVLSVKGLSPIAPITTEHLIEDVKIAVEYYLHPKPEHWTLSNEKAAKAIFWGMFKDPSPMRSVKCFVCTHDDPGCEGDLSPSSTHLIQDCVGSVETTVPIGCQILAGQFEYPHKTYFFRGCLYKNYLGCYVKRSGISIVDPDDKWSINFPDRVGCLNKVRNYLGLRDYDTNFPAWRAKAATRLYIVPGEREPRRFKDDWTISYSGRGNLSNSVVIEGLISKQNNPNDFKINGEFSCHTCDTQTGYCGGNKGEIITDLPHEQCLTHKDAFGCMIMYSFSTSEWKPINPEIDHHTKWMRRGCWYKGDLFCLKSLPMPSSPGRSGGVCPPPKKKCNARKLLTEGKTVYWEGERALNRWNWNRKWHEDTLACLRNNRLRLGVTETLPELPSYDDALPIDEHGSGFMYSFCAGRTLCNDKKTPNVDKQAIIKRVTTTSTPSTSTTTVVPPPTTTKGGGGGECDPDVPDDEVDIDDCECEGPNCEDRGWLAYTLVVIGVIVTLAMIGIGVWWYKRRRARIGPGGRQPMQMQQGQSQFNLNRMGTNYPPGQRGLSQMNSNGFVAAHSSAQLPKSGTQ